MRNFIAGVLMGAGLTLLGLGIILFVNVVVPV